MGIDTKADDWEIAAHRLKVNSSNGAATMSFKIGSIKANQAALIGCVGPIAGSGIPDDMPWNLATAFMNSFSGPWSLTDIKGHRGDIEQNTSIIPDEMRGVAMTKKGSVMFNFQLPNSESLSFSIKGMWMVKSILKLRDTFNIP